MGAKLQYKTIVKAETKFVRNEMMRILILLLLCLVKLVAELIVYRYLVWDDNCIIFSKVQVNFHGQTIVF